MNNSRLTRLLTFRLLAFGFVLYYLLNIVRGYIKGGPDAPSTLLTVLSAVVLGGGAIMIAVMTWKEYKRIQAEEAEEKEKQETLPAREEEPEEETE